MSLEDLDDAELDELAEAVFDERRRRLLERNDPATIADDAFTWFDSRGGAPDPQMVGGFVVCWGSLRGRPQGHKCSFTSVDGSAWCWDHAHEHDEMRWAADDELRTVTLVIPRPAMTFTQVDSVASNAGHQRRHTESWVVEGGSLVPCPTPVRIPEDHRR